MISASVLPGKWYRVWAPRDESFSAAIQKCVPYQFRRYDPRSQCWMVFAAWWPEAERLLRNAFGPYTELSSDDDIPEAQVRARQEQERRDREQADGAEAECRQRENEFWAAQEQAWRARAQAEEDAWGARERARRATASPAAPADGDPYAALGLLPTARPEVAKAAYKALCLLCHPDRGGDTSEMQRINAAWDRIRSERGIG